jgi:very-short-patch-repair endonuclease
VVTERKSKERKKQATLRSFAKMMRHIPTDAEKKFWWMVRDRRLGRYKFKRQYPIGNYIADFVCIEARLIVELDGGQHAEGREYDAKRDAFFAAQGFRVLRLWNPEFLKNQEAVARQLLAGLDSVTTPSPQPSPPLRGGEGDRPDFVPGR